MTTLFQDPFSFDESSGILDQPSSGIGMAAQAPSLGGAGMDFSPGIGVAPPDAMPVRAPARRTLRDDVREEFAGLSTMEKIGAGLQEFSAGVEGRPSPMRQRVEERRK